MTRPDAEPPPPPAHEATAPGRLPAGRAVQVFAVFAFGYFLSALVRAVTATLAPTLSADLGLSAGDLGLLSGAYFFGFALTQLPLGRWLDQQGPRRVLAAFLMLAVLGCLAFALARDFAALTVARALTGAGVGACLMAALTGFRHWYSLGAQLRANSWMLMSGSCGMLASTLPVQMLLPRIGWRGLFLALAVLFVIAIGAVLWRVPRAQQATAASVVSSGGGGYAEVWRHPMFRRYALLGFINYAGMMSLQTLWIGPWLVEVAGLSPRASAGGLFIVNAAMLLAFLGWGFAMPRLSRAGWPPERLIVWGVPLSVGVLAANLALGPGAGAPAWALFCVSNTFMSLAQPLVGRAFPAPLAGRAMSAYNLVIFAGVFAMQWGIGLAVDLLQWQGADTASALRGALCGYALCCAAAYLDHLRRYRRHTVSVAATRGEHLGR